MIPEIIILIGSFLIGLTITIIDFNYWYPISNDKRWYIYFTALYLLMPIGWLLTLTGTLFSTSSIIKTIIIAFGGLLLGYAPTGILYSAYDLGRNAEEVWLAPNIYISMFKWYIIHLILLLIGGILILVGGNI